MREHNIQNGILNAVCGEAILYRANVGEAWVGQEKRIDDATLLLLNPRRFSTGLPKGFPDLFGFVPTVITEQHVGQTLPIFAAIECKSADGSLRLEQSAILTALTNHRALCGVARSDAQARQILGLPPRVSKRERGR